MRRKQLIHLFIYGILCLLTLPCNLFAQETNTPKTHAEAASRQWKGIDVDKVIKNGEYPDGKKIFLFNVGTGCFIIDGGNWGVEGRLFHEDFGRAMTLLPTGRINSGITESNLGDNKNNFCARPPEPFGRSWSDYNKYNYTTIMDGEDKTNYKMTWSFERVEDPSDTETYTYYMYLSSTTQYDRYAGKDFYLGAAWGECHYNPKGDGRFIFLDDDRACWTTVNVQDENAIKAVPLWDTTTEDGVYLKQENGKAMLENGDLVDIQKLYQWRLVSEEEFIAALSDNLIGLNPSVSYLIPDRDFSRNSDDFSKWVTERKEGGSYTQNGRLGYTWGYRTKETNSLQKQYNNEPWNVPVRLKEQFDDKNGVPAGDNSMQYGMKNSKFGYLSFEGVGRVHTSFEVPQPGWYLVQCYGFCQSNTNDAYLYAKVEGGSSSTANGGFSSENLRRIPNGTYQKDTKPECLKVGKELLYNGEDYKTMLWICVTDANQPIQIGFGKDAATQSDGVNNSNTTYYYDTDWVCVDDIRVSYMGLAPAFFYEEEESLDYLNGTIKEYAPLTDLAGSGRFSGAVILERTLKKNQWNSFSFPISLTGEQIRYAFGEDAILAKVHSVGELSQSYNVIDFVTVDLMTSDVVVKPGHFYLLKPTNDPVSEKGPTGDVLDCYPLGRNFFSIDAGTVMTQNNVSSLNNANDGIEFANYIQTPGFETFSVSGGTYNGTADTKGVYAPKGGYAVSNNTIYHLNKDTPIKGFRGWITLTNPVEGEVENVTGMAVDGIMEDLSAIEDIPIVANGLSDDTSVYDICGRRVGTMGTALPRGMYIVNGKKFMVR
ncbi:MAG: hypothetical protein IKT00_04045 [Prevotella sp.]|nr:hypothetical protein [Prevotella sp.]